MGWLGFLGENVVVSHNREWLITQLGSESTYRSIYSLCSTMAMSSIVYGYLKYARNSGPVLWKVMPKSLQAGAVVFQALGLMGFSQCLPGTRLPVDMNNNWQVRCPFDFNSPEEEVSGMKRVTRHDKLWSFGLLGLGTAMGTPFMGEVVMFAFPVLFALIGGAHQDYRYRRNMGGSLSPEMDAVTSNVPFYAFITGKQKMEDLIKESKPNNAILALVIAGALYKRRVARLSRFNML